MKVIKSAVFLTTIAIAVSVFTAVSAEAARMYTYYPSGRLQSVTLTPPDGPDRYGNICYYYLDENWKSQGYGRVSKMRRQTPLNGELSYTLTYFRDGCGRLQLKTAYADSDWRIPMALYTYYNDVFNRLESKSLMAPDAAGNIYYHYLNKRWDNLDYGRIDRSRRLAPLNGELSHTYIYYWGRATRLKEKRAYSDKDWRTFIAVYGYYDDAANLLAYKQLNAPDPYGNVRYEYLNEDFQGRGYGRFSRIVRADGSYELFVEYWPGSEQPKTKKVYNKRGLLTVIYEYDRDGRLASIGLPNGLKIEMLNTGYTVLTYPSGNIKTIATNGGPGAGAMTYNFLDEPFYGATSIGSLGRMRDRKHTRDGRVPGSGGSDLYVYDYWGATDKIRTVRHYDNNPYYYTDFRLIRETNYNTCGGVVRVTDYSYYIGTENIKSKALSTPDSYGNVRYEYIDENFRGRGYGRLSKVVKSNNSYEVFVEYWGDTEQVKIKELYDASGTLIRRYYYDQNGNRLPQRQLYTTIEASFFDSRQAADDNFVKGRTNNVYGQPAGWPVDSVYKPQ